MFGIDSYVLETLLPSVVGVAAMAGAMVWAFIKVRHLMNDDQAKK